MNLKEKNSTGEEGNMNDEKIDPWGSGGIRDYEQTMEKFGIEPMSEIIEEVPEPHRLMRRGIILGQRDFGRIAEAMRKENDFALLTGLMPSGKFHFGHKMVADQIIYYQNHGAEVYVCVADVEVHNTRDIPLDKAREIAIDQYLKNYIAMGLEPEKCNFYFQSEGPKEYQVLSKLLADKTTLNEMEAIYGDLEPGKIVSILTQIADILYPQMEMEGGPRPTITPVGFDQDPHARLTRDVASRAQSEYGFIKPSFTFHKFMRGLKGGKMSSSDPNSYIALTDSIEEAKEKIDRAKTGGRDTLEEHREKGAVIEEDTVFELLNYHLIEDDAKLKEIYKKYSSGEMLSGELKQIAKEKLEEFLEKHHEKRKEAEGTVEEFL